MAFIAATANMLWTMEDRARTKDKWGGMKISRYSRYLIRKLSLAIVVLFGCFSLSEPFTVILQRESSNRAVLRALSSKYLENDLVSIAFSKESPGSFQPRLCAVKPDGTVVPLCRREDDVETDLFADPREFDEDFWTEVVSDEHVQGIHGEGYYGQRPVPSLGGGPGYGAEADEIWSVSEDMLESITEDGVKIPRLDMGISHGEKARGGSF